MKIRSNYVSNSSSSSFLIVYDKKSFNEIIEELKKSYLGMSKITNDLSEFYKYDCVEEEIENWKRKVEEYKNSGKGIVYANIEYDYEFIQSILEIMNKKLGGDKIEFIKGDVY
jgi:uncharacterized protein YecE (DUF72 family)